MIYELAERLVIHIHAVDDIECDTKILKKQMKLVYTINCDICRTKVEDENQL